ncbi:MAG: M1 family aminopeptidase, partial [SAR202 cluster bacterium]|nr:M1 family aminopeptidase [SAR202 cluster bacterium]
RRCFPCWDEPSVKATFEVTLIIPSELKAVSNMEIVNETDEGNAKTKLQFAETPIMSTYLLAFIVGDIACVEDTTPDGTLMRVWATRGNEEKGQFALETSIDLLAYFNDYFGIPYPLSKLDHLALPDFAAGAMENWGAITYRETALLVDPENSSAGTREVVAAIISHEMAHQWFGDLVTMAWWDDLWLNESFASWMGDKAVDALHPEWEMWTQFLSNDTMSAFSLDGLQNSHPIEQEVKNPDEIGQLFDAISYSKGGSILRMLEQYLGADDFQKGLNIYLNRHSHANARTRDLWNALGEASGQPVADIMDTWTGQTGYPFLDAEIKRDDTGIEVSLSQSRFLYENVLDGGQPPEQTWKVPLTIRTASDADPVRRLMETTTETVQMTPASHGSTDEWIKVNPGQTAFFRVRYPAEELEKLTEPIRSLALPAADRLGIQADAYALTKAGHIPVTHFLTVAEAYQNETDASVCGDLAFNLNALDNLLSDEDFYPRFQAFARGIFAPIGRNIGWDVKPGEGHRDALLRSTVLSELGHFEDEGTLAEAQRRFQGYSDDPSSLDPDMRAVVFEMAAQRGDRQTYDQMWDLEKTADLHEEKIRFLNALSSFEQGDLLQETLDRALGTDVRSQDTIRVIVTVASNRHGRNLAWEFVKDNWNEINRRYGDGGFALMRLVGMTSLLTTEERRQDVENFFNNHPAPAAERTISQSLERMKLNITWADQNRDELAKWLIG